MSLANLTNVEMTCDHECYALVLLRLTCVKRPVPARAGRQVPTSSSQLCESALRAARVRTLVGSLGRSDVHASVLWRSVAPLVVMVMRRGEVSRERWGQLPAVLQSRQRAARRCSASEVELDLDSRPPVKARRRQNRTARPSQPSCEVA